MPSRLFPYLALVLTLAAAYFAAAWLGLKLAFAAAQVSAVWPPTGIALAALLVFGFRVWPGITLGAFLINVRTDEPAATAFGIAVGNTLEAVVGAWLLRRCTGFGGAPERLTDALGLVTFGAGLSTVVSATVGVTSLCLGGVHPWSAFGHLWSVWWLGDATGALVVAPALLAWASWPQRPWPPRRVAEAAALLLLLLSLGLVIFAGWLPRVTTDHPLEYAIFPFVIWAALHFGQFGSSTVTLVASVIAIWGTVHHLGPFSRGTDHEDLILLQSFMAVVAVTGLLLSAAITERDRADRRRLADLAITHILAESATLAEATPRILRTIGECLEWDFGAIWAVDPKGPVLRWVAGWQAPGVAVSCFEALSRGQLFTPGIGLPGRVWSGGRPAWIADVTRDPNFPRADVAAREGLHGAFAFPIVHAGAVEGVVEFFSRAIRQPDPALLQLFAAVGSQIGQFLDRQRAGEAVRQGEELLRLNEERLRAIVSQATAGIAQTDLEGRFVVVNRKYCEIVGYSEAELLERRMHDVTHPEDLPRNEAQFDQAVADGTDFVIEKRYVRKDGSVVWVNNSVTLVRDGAGRPQGILAVVIDVTERRRAEEALQQADRRKDEFLAMLAHELRNPLAPICNALQILRAPGTAGAAVEEAVGVLERQVRHLVRLVDDLLDVSRIMRGRIDLRKERLDLAAVVAQAVETVRPVLDARGHELTVALPAEPVRLVGDGVRLAQVFANLLHNAAKYTEGPGRIRLSAAREDGSVAVRVQDSGVGIAPEVLPHIFDLFVQADRSIARSQGGLGIGLTIVRRLVNLHGGTITATSAGPGRGSEFVVRLPALPATDSLRESAAGGPSPPPGNNAIPSRRILVVDDNVDAARSLATLLRLLGHAVRTAHDGAAALEAAGAERPELVFLDIGLPGMDGYEVARRLRQEPGLRRTRLVALTGYGQEEDRRRSEQAGFDRHVVKPVDLAVLKALLADLEAPAR
jgi:PAS domain S-box-containing protein